MVRTGVVGLTVGVSNIEVLTPLFESLVESTTDKSVLNELLDLDSEHGVELRSDILTSQSIFRDFKEATNYTIKAASSCKEIINIDKRLLSIVVVKM